MSSIDPIAAREFAVDVVRRLRAAGHEAMWAGGCVRDDLLGKPPEDYDVATAATPEQIRVVFGKRRTLAIGAAFGVITVLGPRRAGQIDVATFRRDATYSDGRHPDSVSFSTSREDASRRDFTINGLFFDPLNQQVIDYVGGQEDLAKGIVRAIGDAHRRISEDKLRMLRAVRFAGTLGFEIEEQTLAAVREHAHELPAVSAERIGDELRRMLVHPRRRQCLELLRESSLLKVVLPEASDSGDWWRQTVEILERLREPTAAVAVAALCRHVWQRDGNSDVLSTIAQRWKLSNQERDGSQLCLREEATLRGAAVQTPWPTLQHALTLPRIHELLCYCEAVALVVDGSSSAIDFCRAKLALPKEAWNPEPLISGDDLRASGIPPGPIYKLILNQVRDAQLLGEIATPREAVRLAAELWRAGGGE